jgi:sialidase-1
MKEHHGIILHQKLIPLDLEHHGPFVRLPHGDVVGPDTKAFLRSSDGGASWTWWPYFEYGERDKEYKALSERTLLLTREGVLILSFVNANEVFWDWDNETKTFTTARNCHYVMRSLDEGKTWEEVNMLHDRWTGDVRNAIELKSGRIVISSMNFLNHPPRHSVLTYVSDDQGETWQHSNIIDLGGRGHHGGVSEATIAERTDGSLLMYLRTNWQRFWRAISYDGGLSWRDIGPSSIETGSAPGLLKRLASGRLMLLYNPIYPEGESDYPTRGGDNIWSEVPVSNHRSELAVRFSEDDGESWSDPVVLMRHPAEDSTGWISYPEALEYEPGLIWVTTMQGGPGARAAFHEADFV